MPAPPAATAAAAVHHVRPSAHAHSPPQTVSSSASSTRVTRCRFTPQLSASSRRRRPPQHISRVCVMTADKDGKEERQAGNEVRQEDKTRSWYSTLKKGLGKAIAQVSVVLGSEGYEEDVLPYEKPLVDLDRRIEEVRQLAEDSGVDVTAELLALKKKSKKLRNATYSRLSPPQRLSIARHPKRPSFLDVATRITDTWVELICTGSDDQAIVGAICTFQGRTCMFIGTQKGRDAQEAERRNSGMPSPDSYRKALRLMKHAERFGFPIITFIDTPSASEGKEVEVMGQAPAIGLNLMAVFGLRVPIISVVLGEGGSGGGLAIAVSDMTYMMENAVYYIASPEVVGETLWDTQMWDTHLTKKTDVAAEALKNMTSNDLLRLGITDAIIPEPLGGAHKDPATIYDPIKQAISKGLIQLEKLSVDELILRRNDKYRRIGVWGVEDAEGAMLQCGPLQYKSSSSPSNDSEDQGVRQVQYVGSAGEHSGKQADGEESGEALDEAEARAIAWLEEYKAQQDLHFGFKATTTKKSKDDLGSTYSLSTQSKKISSTTYSTHCSTRESNYRTAVTSLKRNGKKIDSVNKAYLFDLRLDDECL